MILKDRSNSTDLDPLVNLGGSKIGDEEDEEMKDESN